MYCFRRKSFRIVVPSTSVTSTVLDASAMLAYLNNEPGADIVFAASFDDAVMSAVNYSEVLKKTVERQRLARAGCVDIIRDLAVAIIPFDEAHAEAAAALYPDTKPFGCPWRTGPAWRSGFSGARRS
jgi:ribonuclease VapC